MSITIEIYVEDTYEYYSGHVNYVPTAFYSRIMP